MGEPYCILLTTFIYLNLSWAKSDKCNADSWPVYVSSGYSDKANCLAYDTKNKIMIVGGTSEDISSDNVLVAKTGFAFALDIDGNWMWSNTFVTNGEAMSEINQCAVSSDAKSSVVFGMLNGLPAII